MKEVTLVVPVYKTVDILARELPKLLAIKREDTSIEILIIDDGSADQTLNSGICRYVPDIRLYFNKDNVGYAKACNMGARLATGNLLFFLNSDIEYPDSNDWLQVIREHFLNASTSTGIVGCVHQLASDGRTDHTGVRLNLNGDLEHSKEFKRPGDFHDVFAISGAAFGVTRDHFHAINGFDEKFLNGCEDIDFCFRMREQGLRVSVDYRSRIKHHVSASRGRDKLRDERNSFLLYRTWYEVLLAELKCLWVNEISVAEAKKLQKFLEQLGFPLNGSEVSTEGAIEDLAHEIANRVLSRKLERWNKSYGLHAQGDI